MKEREEDNMDTISNLKKEIKSINKERKSLEARYKEAKELRIQET